MEKPFFSTQKLYPISLVIAPCIAIGVIALCIVINLVELASPLLLMLISIGCGALLGLPIVKAVGLRKSYIEFYEDHIEGIAVPSKLFGGLNEMRSFELKYDEIITTSSKKDIVTIAYNGGNYEVQAYKSEQKVIKLIKHQKHLLGQNNSNLNCQ